MPVAAKANTAAGAEAFATYFMKQVNLSYRSGDPSLILRLSKTSCKSCNLYKDSVNQYNEAGQKYVGDFATVTTTTISTIGSSSAEVFVTTDTGASRVLDKDGTVVQTLAPEKTNLLIYLSRKSTDWVVSEVKVAT